MIIHSNQVLLTMMTPLSPRNSPKAEISHVKPLVDRAGNGKVVLGTSAAAFQAAQLSNSSDAFLGRAFLYLVFYVACHVYWSELVERINLSYECQTLIFAAARLEEMHTS